MSSTIQFSFRDSQSFTLKDYDFNALKNTVNGDLNIGELRFDSSDGKIHRLNHHDFWTSGNQSVTSIAENAVTRHAVLRLLESQFENEISLRGIFNEIREKLVGDADICKPISRDEVRFMINLLESESAVSKRADLGKKFIMTPEQARAKLELSSRLKTCSSAVRNAWAKCHGDEIRNYIKGWGKSHVLDMVSKNVSRHESTSVAIFDPALVPSNSADDPTPAKPAKPEAPTAPDVAKEDPASTAIKSRLDVRTRIAGLKSKLMASLRQGLGAERVTEYLGFNVVFDELLEEAQKSLTATLRKVDDVKATNPSWASALEKHVKELPFVRDSGAELYLDRGELSRFLREKLVGLVERKAQRALDLLFSSCVSTDDLNAITEKQAGFLANFDGNGPFRLLFNILNGDRRDVESFVDVERQNAVEKIDVSDDGVEQFDDVERQNAVEKIDVSDDGVEQVDDVKPFDDFDLNLFGKTDVPKAFKFMFRSMEMWTDTLVNLDEAQTDEIRKTPMPTVLPLDQFMELAAADIDPLFVENEQVAFEMERAKENIRMVSDLLGKGKLDTSSNVGLYIGKGQVPEVAIRLKATADSAAIILGRDHALQAVVNRLKQKHPELALKILKSLINAHHVVRPRKMTTLKMPETVSEMPGDVVYDYCLIPKNCNSKMAMERARKILETHDEDHEEIFATEQEVGDPYEDLATLQKLPKSGELSEDGQKMRTQKTAEKIQAFLGTRGDHGTVASQQRARMGNELMRMIKLFMGDADILLMSPKDAQEKLEDLGKNWGIKTTTGANSILGNIQG